MENIGGSNSWVNCQKWDTMWWFLARDSLVGCWLEKWLSVCRQRSGIEQDAILWFSGLEWLLLQSSSKDHARSVSFNHNSVPYRG